MKLYLQSIVLTCVLTCMAGTCFSNCVVVYALMGTPSSKSLEHRTDHNNPNSKYHTEKSDQASGAHNKNTPDNERQLLYLQKNNSKADSTPPYCTGTGVCSASASPNDGINMAFCYVPGQHFITINFSLSALYSAEPWQQSTIRSNITTYTFLEDFYFTDPVFLSLGLPQTAHIPKNVPGKMTVIGDNVTISMPIS